MTDYQTVQVWSDRRIEVGEPGESVLVTVLSGGTVFYGDQNVTSLSYTGSLSVGQAVAVASPATWLISASQSLVSLYGGSAAVAATDPVFRANTAYPAGYVIQQGSSSYAAAVAFVSAAVFNLGDWTLISGPGGLTRRRRLRNEHRNPLAVGLNGWSKTDPVGGSGVSFSTVTDTDLGSCGEYTVTHDGSASRFIAIFVGDNSATYGVPVNKTQVAFGRISAKTVAKPAAAGDVALDLQVRFIQSNGTLAGGRVAQHKNRFDSSATTILEGFDNAVINTAFVQTAIVIYLPAVAGVYTFRVGRPQVVVDPDTEVQAYVDGSMTFASWTGTANQSASEGFAVPALPLPYEGFHNNALASSHAPAILTAAESVALMQESGDSIVSFGIAQADLDAAWPSASASIDWTVTPYAALLNSLRAAGKKALVGIGSTPTWSVPSNLLKDMPTSEYPRLAQAYNALLERWPDVIVGLSVWNEPNINISWGAAPSAAKLVDVLQSFYPAVKARHPQVKVMNGGLATYMVDDAGGQSIATYAAAMYAAGVKGFIDAFNLHTYPSDPSSCPPASAGGFLAGLNEMLLAVREARRNASDGIPIWITECGVTYTAVPTWTELTVAQFMLLTRGMLRRAGDVEAFVAHALIEDSTTITGTSDYGHLEYGSFRRRAAFDALANGFLPGRVWRPLVLQNSWVPYTTSGNNLDPGNQYRKDSDTKMVGVRVCVKSGSSAGATIATLPPGYRPENMHYFALDSGGTTVGMGVVYPSGLIAQVIGTSTTFVGAQTQFPAET